MKLYSGPVSMFGAKAEIAALEKKIELVVEFVPFNLKTFYSPKHHDVLRINPKGQVPVLIDGDLELFDSTQIFEYFEETSNYTPLWPKDRLSKAEARLLELKSDEVFFQEATKLMPRQRENLKLGELQEVFKYLDNYCCEMDTRLINRTYLAGDFSYADIAFFCAHFFAILFGYKTKQSLGNLEAWKTRMTQRSSVKSVVGNIVVYLAERGIHFEEVLGNRK